MTSRILFVAEAVTLAHVARACSLASALDPDCFQVCLACDPRYNALLGELPFPTRSIATIPAQRFFRAIAKGTPIYDAATLIDYVAADRRLLQDYRPDAVVGDFRLSLGVSARLAGIPYLNISNAYWSPYARLRYPVPDIPLTRIAGVALAQRLFDLARPLAFALHARPLNQARRHFGLPPLPADLRHAYTEADQVLYADVPELVPTRGLPENHHFLGPIAWSPRVPVPDWWGDLPEDKPIVYVTLGSSGQAERLPVILGALASLPVSVIAASAGCALTAPLPDNVWMSDFLPGDQAARRAALVICNGGSPTSYQGLAAGVPVIGLASNLDQYLNMNLIAEAGAGYLLRASSASLNEISAATRRCLDSETLRLRARSLQAAIEQRDAAGILTRLLDNLPGQSHA
jgi:UDP:flavonoid glycosyltransferase YjiC (YdhE family)